MENYPVNRALFDAPLFMKCEREPLSLVSMIAGIAIILMLQAQNFAFILPTLVLWLTAWYILKKLADYDPRFCDRALRRVRIRMNPKNSWK